MKSKLGFDQDLRVKVLNIDLSKTSFSGKISNGKQLVQILKQPSFYF